MAGNVAREVCAAVSSKVPQGCVSRIDEARDWDVAAVGVGQMRVAIGHGQLGRLDPGVDSVRVGHPVRAEHGRGGAVLEYIQAETSIPELLGGWVVTRTPR